MMNLVWPKGIDGGQAKTALVKKPIKAGLP
jgi:hypothetical protein